MYKVDHVGALIIELAGSLIRLKDELTQEVINQLIKDIPRNNPLGKISLWIVGSHVTDLTHIAQMLEEVVNLNVKKEEEKEEGKEEGKESIHES